MKEKLKNFIGKHGVRLLLKYFCLMTTRNFLAYIKLFYHKYLLRKKIHNMLFIGQVHSPHFKSFHNNIVNKICLPNTYIHNIYVCSFPVLAYVWFGLIFDRAKYPQIKIDIEEWENDIFLNGKNNIKYLNKIVNKTIRNNKIDTIWIHDLQSGGYLLDLDTVSNEKIIITLYGNDLYFFKNYKIHSERISSILDKTSLLHTETLRDQLISRNTFSYGGDFLPIISATASTINSDLKPEIVIDKEYFLIVKGSYRFRSTLIDFFKILQDEKDFYINKKIIIFGASPEDTLNAYRLNHVCGLNIETTKVISNLELMNLMKKSIFHLSATLSDGVANTCKEAVINDCIPIITNHNGFKELIDLDYRQYLITNLKNGAELTRQIDAIHNNKVLRDKIKEKLLANVKNYYSINKNVIFINHICNFLSGSRDNF